jgi:uncharacterized membrane protein YfcA
MGTAEVSASMPELFPGVVSFVLCALVVAGAQFIYATVGFGAGMFSIALLALILPDLADAVAILLVPTVVTEVWVLARAWRAARLRLLLALLPTMVVGMWLGAELLATGDVAWLKRALGIFVFAAGSWFLYQELRGDLTAIHEQPDDDSPPSVPARRRVLWVSLPTGLISGVLTGLFGTGGPPVIILLRGYRLSKGVFRSTMLSYFLIMSVVRAANYIPRGLLTLHELNAALWLLPATLLGAILGTVVHHRISERQFGIAVAVLLIFLGVTLAIGGGK